MIDGLLSALNADTDETKRGTVTVKPVVFITIYSCNIKMWVTTFSLPEGTT